MAGPDVLLAVSRSVQQRLASGLDTFGPPVADVQLYDRDAPPPAEEPRATLFLHDVVVQEMSRDRPRGTQPVGRGGAPRTVFGELLLCYLVAAWADDPATEQQVLGRVVQTLYENPVISGTGLAGDLAGTAVQLQVSLANRSVQDRARIWRSLGVPFRLCVVYEVRVVDV